ncbi:DUF2690 domain-containing protein [Streptomyces sp. NPDC017405]|uniref:helix-turn-helix domain-containing protein n=1 Tax=unclassified Streptomyces TaxID=2593676 RepID=UPI003789C97D
MPRWNALPDDLDPRIEEFTGRLRQLVDRSGLSVAELAGRTGYGASSWERYLSGRLLAPKGAVIALAEAAGAPPGPLTTLWELAERAWTRAEVRQGSTRDALRAAASRAALEDVATAAEPAAGTEAGTGAARLVTKGAGAARRAGTGGDSAVPGTAGVSGAPPAVPATGVIPAQPSADTPVKNSWGLAGYRGPSTASARPVPRPAARPDTSASTPAATPSAALAEPSTGPHTPVRPVRTQGTPAAGTVRPAPQRPEPGERWSARRQQLTMFLAGLVGVLVLIGGVVFFTHRGGDDQGKAAGRPTPSASARTSPPPGVKCAGSACAGQDAEAMGCSGDLVTTAKTATVGTTTLEVRYSKVCGTAWGRITSGAPGDTVRVTAGKERQTGDITAAGDTIGYTPMVVVRSPAQARACATLASGQSGCTE